MNLTHCIVFFANIEDVLKSFLFWNENILIKTISQNNIEDVLSDMQMIRGWHIEHAYLWAPAGKSFCILVGDDSSNFYNQAWLFNQRYSFPIVGYNIYNPEQGWEYGIKFYHFDSLKNERYVSVMLENGKWTFYEKGYSLPFEQREKYNLRLKRERLTKDMVLSYMKSCQCDVNKHEIYSPSVCYYLDNIVI